MDLDVTIEGVPDARLVKLIERTVHEIAKRASQRGEWSVLVAPSETRGTWDIGIRGPHGHHFASFPGDPADLPHLVDSQLRAALAASPHPGQ